MEGKGTFVGLNLTFLRLMFIYLFMVLPTNSRLVNSVRLYPVVSPKACLIIWTKVKEYAK